MHQQMLVSYGPVAGADAYTVLLLHCDGSDGSTTVTDSSLAGHTVTVNGHAQIDTAQSKFGGASLICDGTGDTLELDGSSDFAFGTGDFTIEFWLRLDTANGWIYDGRAIGLNGDYPALYQLSGTLRYFVDSADRITGASLSNSTWYHIALVRYASNTKLYIDGTQSGSTWPDTTDYLTGADRPMIMGTSALAPDIDGWIDELRVSKGIARWTADFTPPTSAYS
jgi:hypothetical protein